MSSSGTGTSWRRWWGGRIEFLIINMKDKSRITPDMIPKASDYIDVRNTERPDKKRLKEFKKSEKYKEYVQPVLDREKEIKLNKCKEWWWTKGLLLINIILALIAAITGIISVIEK